MTNVLWITSFRPFSISSDNDDIQLRFVDSLLNLKNVNLTLCVTQFGEFGVHDALHRKLSQKNTQLKFFNSEKPIGHKYSQTTIMLNGLSEFIDNNSYDYVIWSTCDILIPSDMFPKIFNKREKINHMACIMPQYHVSENFNHFDSFKFNFGIDLFIFKIDKEIAKKMLGYVQQYENYGWGCYEHFLSAIPDLLKLQVFNIAKEVNITKYGNSYVDFGDTRNAQVCQWIDNNKRLKLFLKNNYCSTYFATGSMYYLFYKNTNFRDLGLIHLITAPHFLFKLFSSLLRFTQRRIFRIFNFQNHTK